MNNFNTSTNRQAPIANKVTAYTLPNGEEMKLSAATVRSYLVRGNGAVSDQEVMMFIALCKSQKLNPFVNDAYLIKYGDKSPATIAVGKGALDKRAEMNTNYDGKECGIIVVGADGQPSYRQGAVVLKGEEIIGGWANVYRKDRSRPEHVEVAFSEYVGRKTNGEINGQWSTKPATMIQKVAVAQALRQAFPNDLNGMYASEEVGQGNPDSLAMPMSSEVIEQAAEPAKIEAPQPAAERMISATPAFTADDLL